MSEKIDKDDLRENGHREGVKLIVGDYLKSFEMFDFSFFVACGFYMLEFYFLGSGYPGVAQRTRKN